MKKNFWLWNLLPWILFIAIGYSLQKEPPSFSEIIKIVLVSAILGWLVGLVIAAIYKNLKKKNY
ncbi:hypothetical protein [Neobacillus sp. 19]|uniref:hypothetical protein n=1 Tax=Neobacillus sp. 19 TaxID=3394458 RepID=UPI003BF71262